MATGYLLSEAAPVGTVNAAAVLASGVGTAYQAAGSLPVTTAPAELASGTGVVGVASVAIAQNTGVAAGTGSGFGATTTTTAAAGLGSGTGIAGALTFKESFAGGLASATGTAGTPTSKLSRAGGLASGTGAANNATVTTSGFPDTTNTGIPVGTPALTASGPITASTNSQTFTEMDYLSTSAGTSAVDVNATSVTFNRCRFRGPNWYVVHIGAGKSATFNDCEFQGTTQQASACYNEGTATYNRCYFHDGDSVTMVGASATSNYTDCYITDLWGYNPGGRSVSDAVFNGTTTVTSNTAVFVAGDVGANFWGAGVPNGTRIASRTNATTVVLDRATTTSGSGKTISLADNTLANHTECIKFTGAGTATVTHCSLRAKWGPNGSNGGGMTGAFHNSGGSLTATTSRLTLEDNDASYVCYFVLNGATPATGSVTNCNLDHYDFNHVADKVHQLSRDVPAPTWSGNVWGDGTTCPVV